MHTSFCSCIFFWQIFVPWRSKAGYQTSTQNTLDQMGPLFVLTKAGNQPVHSWCTHIDSCFLHTFEFNSYWTGGGLEVVVVVLHACMQVLGDFGFW